MPPCSLHSQNLVSPCSWLAVCVPWSSHRRVKPAAPPCIPTEPRARGITELWGNQGLNLQGAGWDFSPRRAGAEQGAGRGVSHVLQHSLGACLDLGAVKNLLNSPAGRDQPLAHPSHAERQRSSSSGSSGGSAPIRGGEELIALHTHRQGPLRGGSSVGNSRRERGLHADHREGSKSRG